MEYIIHADDETDKLQVMAISINHVTRLQRNSPIIPPRIFYMMKNKKIKFILKLHFILYFIIVK
jgi:hypothetical protein